MLKPERKNTWVSAQHLSSSLFLVEDPLVRGIHGLGKEIKGREVGTHSGLSGPVPHKSRFCPWLSLRVSCRPDLASLPFPPTHSKAAGQGLGLRTSTPKTQNGAADTRGRGTRAKPAALQNPEHCFQELSASWSLLILISVAPAN